ncbi:hypothetical protein GIB67_024383, partial [Kingdonia uniflora]
MRGKFFTPKDPKDPDWSVVLDVPAKVYVKDEICIASEQHDIADIDIGQQNNEALYESEKRLQRALVFVGEIGGKDYNYAFFQGKQVEEISTYVPHVVLSITNVVQEVIHEGAIRVVVSGNFPVGCRPIYLTPLLHVALRAPRDKVICSDGKNVVPDVWKVLDKIIEFNERVRSGSWVGATGKALKDVVAFDIGGSFLGPLFVHTALQADPEAITCAKGRQLRLRVLDVILLISFLLSCAAFILLLANVAPIDVARAIAGLNPETTL